HLQLRARSGRAAVVQPIAWQNFSTGVVLQRPEPGGRVPMSRKKFGSIVILVLSAVTMALLAPSVSGQATAPPSSTSSNSTSASAPTPKPRAPTREDVAELKAAMHWPGSTLIGVAIVANFAEACFMKSPENKSMLATITSGKWEKIHETGGC